MVEMINYIFGELETSKTITRNVIKKQVRFNRNMTAFVFLSLIYAVTNMSYNSLQDKEIKKLIKEVEELKRTRGE